MRPYVSYSAVVGALLLIWLGTANIDALADPAGVALLVAMALLVVAVVATYQWRTLLLVITTCVLSGLVLGLALAVMLTDPTIGLSVAAMPFVLGGLMAVWASYRRPALAGAEPDRRNDHVGSPTA
ncbi:hypothetical protein [Agrococcus sp. KRD186]|jgi:hypothetical protein|uniref:hypothetical protein n=1 Tax=Agrococcus sp. KRD186 TaxID=2729730 RepID=UPI0019D0431C|nr:hypothetical protein [Agrococcus sp. KRD186]